MAGIKNHFEENLAALGRYHSALAERLKNTAPSRCFEVRESRSRKPVPVHRSGVTTVHINSPYDPEKEAERFAAGIDPSPSYLLLGLEAGYAEISLLKPDTELVVVVDYDIGFLRFLLEYFDYRQLLLDPRLRFVVEGSPGVAAMALQGEYLPQFHGDLVAVPWRPRERMNEGFFTELRLLLPKVLQDSAIDVSTQKKFGRRWMRNIVANSLPASRNMVSSSSTLHGLSFNRVHVTAAGPSLEKALPALAALQEEECLVATDTSLPFLVSAGLEPDFVVSVDCQHHSYHHFLAGIPGKSILVLDLASPPGLFRFKNPVIPVAGGHPFSRYVDSHFFRFMQIDTSGGNVTHAAVSFADRLGAGSIVLHGADLCYPEGKLYARGTYLYSHFSACAGRTAGLETQTARMLLGRRDIERHISEAGAIVYGTGLLESYRQKLADLAGNLRTRVTVGQGRELQPPDSLASVVRREPPAAGHEIRQLQSWADFCRKTLALLDNIELPAGPVQTVLASKDPATRELLYALMPLAAYYMETDKKQPGSGLLAAAISEARVLIRGSLSRHIDDGAVTDE
ncbi:MAG: DUF115 domain-containing protein [Spirochaetales bacterium]|nr:DUF115 domain-containing protein [Spirochaetales bacterium]